MTDEWKLYRKKGLQPMRPYIPGENLAAVSVSFEYWPPEVGDMIAKDPANPKDQWLVPKDVFAAKYEESAGEE